MNRFSLRARLLIAAGLVIILALTAIAASLSWVFERHVLRQYEATATGYLNQLISGTSVQSDGTVKLNTTLAAPQFNKPLSGYYWQITGPKGENVLRSRSLWDGKLALPPAQQVSKKVRHFRIEASDNSQPLLAWERRILIPAGGSNNPGVAVQFVLAMDEKIIDQALVAFLLDIVPALLISAVLLLFASWLQVYIGLAPLDRMRRGLADVRSGKTKNLEGPYPIEVMPLVDETNNLLAIQREAIEHARNWTADLAHGLKTPLTVLSADADRLSAEGNLETAVQMHELIRGMQRRIDRELIRARIQSSGVRTLQHCDPVKILHGITRALKRTPLGEALAWELDIPAHDVLCARIDQDNLSELIGNLLENAHHWAKTRIRISLNADQRSIQISIEEDGPGVPDEQLKQLGERGIRLDESMPGSGLGLAISADIVSAYHGHLKFTPSKLGGLKVELCLPACS